MQPSPIYILTPTNRENRNLTPTNKIVRSTTPTVYHVPKVYLSKTPQNNYNYAQNYTSVVEKRDRNSFMGEKSTISTEPINKSYTEFTNKSPFNQRNFFMMEEEKNRMEKEIRDLQMENNELRQKLIKSETKSLCEKQKYEEKIQEISSELNRRLINEKNNKKPTKATDTQMLEKLIEDMKKEHVFAMETLKKDNKKTTEMYEMLLKEMENNINELLKKNGMLNLNLKEFERKNRELLLINKKLNKKNNQLEEEKLG